MTARKENPSKRGRKPKAPGDKFEQLTVRLPPKLKFALDLLARHQHRSLSQSLEWALQVGLRSAALSTPARFGWAEEQMDDEEPETLGDLVDGLWEIQNPVERLVALWRREPNLVDFDDRGICELLYCSKDLAPGMKWWDKRTLSKIPAADQVTFKIEHRRLIWDFAAENWDELRALGASLNMQGKRLRDQFIVDVLGENHSPLYNQFVEKMDAFVESWTSRKQGKQK